MYATFKVLVQHAIQAQHHYVQANSMGQAMRAAADQSGVALNRIYPIVQLDKNAAFDYSAL